MKINRIYIAAFGGLKNKTIDFKDGFSVIYGENENGKTTIMTFIKMMFYGSERGSSSIAKNPRKKYAPWSGEKSAGSIDFEHGGRSYRLEREFGNTNSSDKITLTDMSDGTRESLSGNVGERFFGLSAAAFERSVFVGQFGKAESDSAAESEINSKLSNMVTTGDESVSFAAVSDRLQKARFALLSKSGRAGECDKSKKRLAELESELERAEDIYEKHAEYRKNADIINASIEKDAERAAYLKAKIDSEQDIRNAEKLKELLETKDELERAKEELRLTNGGVIDDLYVGKVKMCLAKLDTAAEKLKDKTDEVQRLSVGIADAEDKGGREKIKNLEKEIADLNKKKTETENNISANKKAAEALRATESDVRGKKSGINVVFITVAGFALLAALLLFAFKMQSVALIPAAGAAVSALLSFILRPADKRTLEDYESRLKAFEAEAERLNADKTDVLQQLSLLSARLEAVNTSLGMGTAALENQKKLLLESRKAMEEAENTYKAAEKTLLELYCSYKPAQSTDEIRHELDTLAEKADGLKQIKQKLTYLAKDLGNISYDEARQKLEALFAGQLDVDAEAVGEVAHLLDELGACAGDGLGMDVAAEVIFVPQQPQNGEHPFGGVVGGPQHGAGEEKSLDVVAAVELDGQFCQLPGRKSGPGNIVGLPIDAVAAVEGAAVAHQDLQQADAAAISGKGVAAARRIAAADGAALRRMGRAAGCAGYVIFCAVGQNGELVHQGLFHRKIPPGRGYLPLTPTAADQKRRGTGERLTTWPSSRPRGPRCAGGSGPHP